jgi:hypothetical protein
MKMIVTTLITLLSLTSLANTIIYTNDEGCRVEKEQRRNGVLMYITNGEETEYVGYGNDYSFGSFAYCSDKKTEVNYYEGSKGTGIMVSCSSHTNGHKTTRGRVDISIIDGDLKEIKIDGQVKRSLLGWKQDVLMECSNLVRE